MTMLAEPDILGSSSSLVVLGSFVLIYLLLCELGGFVDLTRDFVSLLKFADKYEVVSYAH
jgi:hypothetical protein